MINTEKLKDEIVQRLKPLNLERVILFGSYANGSPKEDSDIDLYVVTKDEFIPKNFREKRDLARAVSSAIRDLRGRVPIDLIVHTKGMYKKFSKLNSSFADEVLKQGRVLL